MKLKRSFWIRIIPFFIMLVVTMIMSAVIYRQMIDIEEETCWERLRIATESTAQKIEIRITDNLNFLDAVSDSYILRNYIDHEHEVVQYLTSIMSKTIFESIEVILPDRVITQQGEIIGIAENISYDELVKQGRHISPRSYDDAIGAEVIYCFMPIDDDDGNITGMLCGKLKCKMLSEIFEVYTFKGQSQLFLIDCSNGDYIIDNWHSSLGNLYEMGDRVSIDGNEIVNMVEPIINRQSGRMSYISKTNGQHSYQYYTPVNNFNWELCVVVQEDIVFKNLNNLRRFLTYVGVVECIIVIIALLWNVWITVAASKSEQKARELELTRATNEAKARFISNMSHDIRTPLNGIVGMLHIIKKHRDEQSLVDDCLRKIEVSTQYLSTLASDMLDINEIESNKLVLENRPIDLIEMADEISVMIEPKAKESNIKYVSDCSGLRNPYVTGSPVHIHRVLINLIGNAIKYCKKDGGEVRVSFTETDDNLYRFIIEDNGIGMSEEFQKNMYNAFAQERQNARSSYDGYGLGLTIVYRLVQKMGGTIALESEKGKGSIFTVTLPLKPVSEDNRSEIKKSDEIADLGGIRVLLAEDNEVNMEIAEIILSDAGAEVIPAENGKVACEIFSQSEYGYFNLILMDIMMPEMDGYEAAATIRKMNRPDASAIPIFAMTAHTFSDEIKRCKEAGMNEHIAKPLDVDNLMSKAAKYCKKNR